MSLDFWSPGRALKSRPESADPFEFPACRSRLFTDNGTEPGPRVCRVNHGETGEVLHGSWVGTVWSSWSDAVAAQSLADSGPRPVPQCSDCTLPATTRGLCAGCAGRELAVDDREDAGVEA